MVIISRNRLYLSPGIDGIRLALMILLFSIGADECGRIGYPNIPSEYFTRIVQWIFHLCNIKCAHKICFKLEKRVFHLKMYYMLVHYSYVLYGVLKQHLSTAVLNVHKTYGPLREKTKAQTSLCIRSGLEITQLLQRPSAAVQSVGKDHFLVGKGFSRTLFYPNMLIWSGHFFHKTYFYLIIEAYLFSLVYEIQIGPK